MYLPHLPPNLPLNVGLNKPAPLSKWGSKRNIGHQVPGFCWFPSKYPGGLITSSYLILPHQHPKTPVSWRFFVSPQESYPKHPPNIERQLGNLDLEG